MQLIFIKVKIFLESLTWESELFKAWERYNAGDLSSKELLTKLGKLSRKHAAQQWKELEESVAEESE